MAVDLIDSEVLKRAQVDWATRRKQVFTGSWGGVAGWTDSGAGTMRRCVDGFIDALVADEPQGHAQDRRTIARSSAGATI